QLVLHVLLLADQLVHFALGHLLQGLGGVVGAMLAEHGVRKGNGAHAAQADNEDRLEELFHLRISWKARWFDSVQPVIRRRQPAISGILPASETRAASASARGRRQAAGTANYQ